MTVTNTVPPAITGSAVQGQTLQTSNGSWTFDEDYLTYVYEWLRCDAAGNNCSVIGGQSGPSYLLGAIDVGKTIRSRVTATEHASSPSTAYINYDFVDIRNPPWTTIQTYYGSGNSPVGVGVQGDPPGRVQLVTAPDAVGRALRFELNNNEPWPPLTVGSRSQLQAGSGTTTWGPNGFSYGCVRWFDFELWLPNAFDYARANWNLIFGLHPSVATGWGTFEMTIENNPSAHPQYMQMKIAGGSPVGTLANLHFYNLFQVTNANGTPYAPNRNRRISVVLGGKFASDNSGWFEAWVDGVNVRPRVNGPIMWTGEGGGQYMKIGPYKKASSDYPSGETVLYYTKVAVGEDRPF